MQTPHLHGVKRLLGCWLCVARVRALPGGLKQLLHRGGKALSVPGEAARGAAWRWGRGAGGAGPAPAAAPEGSAEAAEPPATLRGGAQYSWSPLGDARRS